MKKIIITILILLLTVECACAKEIVSRITLNDGTQIFKCEYANGRIDYCSQEDAQKALMFLNNANKYSIVEEINYKKPKKNLNEKIYTVRQNVGIGANILFDIANYARVVGSYCGI